MKTIAKFLTGLTIAIVLFLAYYIISSRLSVDVTVTVTPASQVEARFNEIAYDISTGRIEGAEALGSVNEYSFVEIYVDARNYSIFMAEWAQFSAKALDGDAYTVESDIGPKDIKSFSNGKFSVTLLTKSGDADRSGWLEYYIFGRAHTLQLAPDANQTI